MLKVFSRYAVVRTRFPHVHRYPSAEGAHEYLRHPHRHLFHVEVRVEQFHDNRDVEYLALLDVVNECVRAGWGSTVSCEQIADIIARTVNERYPERGIVVTVSEDGENGAIVIYGDDGGLSDE